MGPFELTRAAVALALILFLPGYTWSRAFFEKVDMVERVGLSLGLSVALVTMGVLVANKAGMEITPFNSAMVATAILVTGALTEAMTRKEQLSEKIRRGNE